MGANHIIVRDYLESLREDKELDYLFPILLSAMGFNIVRTAVESKGQSQYGKDIIAIGEHHTGERHAYHFEIKGYGDRNITDHVLNKPDGVIESLRASRYTKYTDLSIPGFNELPRIYVLVHNGVLQSNAKPTFDSFIEETFPQGNFERWDLFRLSDLMEEYLFNEFLFVDKDGLKLFKKSLFLLDAPGNDFCDFHELIELQIQKVTALSGQRSLKKFFASLTLIGSIINSYSLENDQLEPAKYCNTFLIIRTWSWILDNNLESKRSIISSFEKLLKVQINLLELYFEKTLSIAQKEDGLFSEVGGLFEEIGYPLRSFDYLNYLIFFFEISDANSIHHEGLKELSGNRRKQKDVLMEIIRNNDGARRPLLDIHSITILSVVNFFLSGDTVEEKDLEFLGFYISSLFENIALIYFKKNRLPVIGGEQVLIKELSRSNKKSEDKNQNPSLLLTTLFQLAACLNARNLYDEYRKVFKDNVNLQSLVPNFDDYDIESLLFKQTLDREFDIKTNVILSESFDDFRASFLEKRNEPFQFRTDIVGQKPLRKLAHIFYGTDLFESDWVSTFLTKNS